MQWQGCGKVGEREHLKGPGMVWLMAFTLLALILRAYRVDFQPLWWDEGWTVYFATADVPSMIARTAIDIHPPFYYLILHLWTLIFGPSAVSVRLFSVGVGTLSIPLMFLVARRLFGRRTALIAALILTVAPFHVYYSQEARMYALVTLLVLASSYLFLLLLEEQASRT
ncbi:MAG: glycosyltransferase family 39 protein, partial [Anaerolineae bacterium]|nr:glycosyltransferase family 39 protein [Anaerolineae bacterium]